MDTMDNIYDYLKNYKITYDKIKEDLSYYMSNKLDIKNEYIYDEYIKQIIFEMYPEYNNGMELNKKDYIDKNKETLKLLLSIPLVEQKSKEWYEYRLNRITASNLASIYNKGFKNRNSCLKDYVEKNLSFKPNVACTFGIKYEDVACQIYEKLNNVKINEFGCLPHPNYDYLAASPDGITDDGVMLEIKCPYSRPINGIPPIKYWYQMQLQLEVCDLNECDYFECRITEYDNEEKYDSDNIIQLNNTESLDEYKSNWRESKYPKQKFKGIVIEVYDKSNKNTKYIYDFDSKLYYKEWIVNEYNNIEDIDNKLIKITYWKCENYYISKIYRDKEWFKNNLIIMKTFWDEVLYYRENKDKYEEYLNNKTKIKVKKNKKKCIIFELEDKEQEQPNLN